MLVPALAAVWGRILHIPTRCLLGLVLILLLALAARLLRHRPATTGSAYERLRQAGQIEHRHCRLRRLGLALRPLGDGWDLDNRCGRVRLLRWP